MGSGTAVGCVAGCVGNSTAVRYVAGQLGMWLNVWVLVRYLGMCVVVWRGVKKLRGGEGGGSVGRFMGRCRVDGEGGVDVRVEVEV